MGSSRAMNRMDGVTNAVAGAGGLCGAACLMLLGWWIALPVCVVSGWKLGQGVAQAITGWGD